MFVYSLLCMLLQFLAAVEQKEADAGNRRFRPISLVPLVSTLFNNSRNACGVGGLGFLIIFLFLIRTGAVAFTTCKF